MTQLSYYPEPKVAVAQLVNEGKSAQQIADELNRLELRPAKRTVVWRADQVRGMVRDLGLSISRTQVPSKPTEQDWRRGDWWTLTAPAVTLGMPSVTLYSWLTHAQVQGRQEGRRWWIWADDQELSRLKARRAKSPAEHAHDRWSARRAATDSHKSKEDAYVQG